MWGISDVTFNLGKGQTMLYPGAMYDVLVDVTVQNLQNVSYPGGRAAFRLQLYLHDSPVLGQGRHAGSLIMYFTR